MLVNRKIVLSGELSQIDFVYYIQSIANSLQLNGFFSILNESQIGLEIEGPVKNVEQFISALKKGALAMAINQINTQQSEIKHYQQFEFIPDTMEQKPSAFFSNLRKIASFFISF